MSRRAVPRLVSRTLTPDTARAEVFRLLWRVMTWNGGDLPLGCGQCERRALLAAQLDGQSVCCACALEAEKAGETVVLDATFDDVHRLEALGFLLPADGAAGALPKDYDDLVKWSRNRAQARRAGE